MSITLAEIRMALPNFTKEELSALNSELVSILKHKRASASHEAIQKFSVGDKVSYEHKGATRKGIITKVNRTRIVVQPQHQLGKVSVPASWLTKHEPAFNPATGAWE